jgi:conjugative relaxase-like TrwC/TraI family protein
MDVGWNRSWSLPRQRFFRTTVHLRPARSIFRLADGVLSVAKLALGQEAYYEQQVAMGLDDYYAGRGESSGLWVGSGAEAIELAGTVEEGALSVLLSGVSPADGERLRAPAKERTICVRTLDESTGIWTDEAKTLAPVAGYDLVFSCPKSVSLLHALTGDEDVRRAISEAHESSWQAALSYLEAEACVSRSGRGGAIREHGEGFVAAAFRHRTSRAQDPHLHTHVVVANLARSPDGAWRALDGQAILRTYRLAAGYLYESQLRHELSRSLRVRWREPVKGMAEIEGVPQEATRAFSTRRQSLVEHMEAMGTSGFAASRVAALATRERKETVDLPELRDSWLARAAEMGLGAIELRGLLGREPAEREVETIHTDDLTAHQTTVTAPELVRAVAGAARDGMAVEDVLAAADEIARRPELSRVGDEPTPGGPARFTTRSLLDLEREAIRIAVDGRDAGAPAANGDALAAALDEAGITLSDEQRVLVEEAALAPDRIVCAIGAAGAGKTTALQVLGDALARSEIPVLAAAPSGRAADELERETDIPSQTLHSLLNDARRSGDLPPGCVLVIDEAGMAETRVLTPVLRMVEEAHGKALLVGDPAQLPAVGAGGLYEALCDRVGAVRLEENHRQRQLSEREALAHLRSGDAEGYLARAAREGRLRIADNATHAKEQLLADWWRAAAEGRVRDTAMLAHRRADVRDLNEAARALMREAGRLGERALVAGDRQFRPGDRVVCRQNDPALGVRNGTRATVRDVDAVLGIVTLQTDAGPSRQLPERYAAEHLEHGYALTGHAAQGASVERAFVLVRAQGAMAEWGYVTASRARDETRLYAVGPELADDAGPVRNDRDPARSLADSLARRAAERPAVELSEGEREAPSPTRARREWLEYEIDSREQLLASVEAELDNLGWLGRRRHGDELREVIDVQHRVLGDARKELPELAVEDIRPDLPPPPERSDDSLSRERGIEREMERGIGLER